jgi:hypothetical protein
MKKIFISLTFVLLSLTSCDFLEQRPKDKVSPEDYFKTETDLQLFTNPLYNNLLNKEPFEQQTDHYVHTQLSNELRGGNSRYVPSTGGGWSWGNLRRINTFLTYSSNCPDEAVVTHYNAIARFFRAFFYFDKVKRFGDVPWIDKELESTDEALYAPRDSRELIMTKMIEDIDFAIANLPEKTATPFRVGKYAALALKAEFCLYEGTFRKYHGVTYPEHDYKYYLDLAAKAAREIMDKGGYALSSDYRMMFAQEDATTESEFILAINNDISLQIFNNSTAYGTMPTQGAPGLTKKFVDSFLMKDGSRFTDKQDWATMEYKDQMKDRDPRLSYCTITPGYRRIGGTRVLATDLSCSVTGYQVSKFVMDETLPFAGRVDMSHNDMPVYRLGEIYLIYAEALAEQGEAAITQKDLYESVNLLRARVGMPPMKMADANANPDPYLLSAEYGYKNVIGENQGLILEIRRERAVELAQEGFRWDDLMRWKEGLCINQAMHGMYFPGPGEYDLTGDDVADICLYVDKKPNSSVKDIVYFEIGKKEGVILSEGTKGYIDPHKDVEHVFNEGRDYLYPIPITERTLNPNLTQNPGWNDGLN